MIRLKSYAKINLYLDIKEKMENGYHCIETLFQTINIYDEIIIRKINKPIYQIKCDNPIVPVGRESIVYQAVDCLMRDKDYGVEIRIRKNIPVAAGLGGGSSNVASILAGICKLFQLDVKPTRLINIALSLGMDIPFFLKRGTVYATGRGELLYPILTAGNPLHVLLVNPGIKVSTKWAYDEFDKEIKGNFKETKITFNHYMNNYINKRKPLYLNEFGKHIYNRFDSIISRKFPVISEIKEKIIELGAVSTTMSGSGPTVFGIMENSRQAKLACRELKNKYPYVCTAKTVKAKNIFLKNSF
ncbi:MAG: 4-(cytidine 5'-diphospho)-2-C-methyl-D-erythritol kinase [Atribacterota bacterium]|nr:4-(cytidine 5'-diphospho)-2-C-methyl-D-erythritol kinase [Atribacterota bacterium]